MNFFLKFIYKPIFTKVKDENQFGLKTFTIILFFNPILCFSQFSGYTSAEYGYNSNPLYNYQRIPDQVKNGFIELNYDVQPGENLFNLKYSGNLSVFNAFSDRNYYEHKLSAFYKILIRPTIPSTSIDSTATKDSDSEDSLKDESDTVDKNKIALDSINEDRSDSISVNIDSTMKYLDFGYNVMARHDKQIFKEFDNFGTELFASYRIMLNEQYYIRLTDFLGYRDYSYIQTLTNVNDQFVMTIGNKSNQSINYGFQLTGGIKHYFVNLFDTSKFELQRSFIVKPPGHGKPGSKIYSNKIIFIEPQSMNQLQFTTGLFYDQKIDSIEIHPAILYRYNPAKSVRYIAHLTGATSLNEDIYNDPYSYEGLETRLLINFKLPFKLKAALAGEFQTRTYGAPALDLNGVEIFSHRKDLRTQFEAYLTRYFEVSQDFGFDFIINAGFIRDQSNDDYNNFYTYTFSVSLGFSF